jgi:hypothetical protein
MRHGAPQYTVKLTSEGLVKWFLAEVLSVIVSYDRYSDAADSLRVYFEVLEQFKEWGDFQMQGTLPRPAPLEIFVEPHALYGRFRAWLRKQGIDPDTVTVSDLS